MTRAKINIPLYAIDFEGSKSSGILEFALIEIIDWKINSISTSLCNAKNKIDKYTLELCDIKDTKDLKAYPYFEENIDTFVKAREKGLFIAHNKATENSLLKHYFPAPKIFKNFNDGKETISWAPWIDTFTLCKKIFPNLNNYSLSEIVKRLNLNKELDEQAEIFCPKTRSKWHCAPYDAIASALILIKIASLDGFENINTKWLCDISNNKEESLF